MKILKTDLKRFHAFTHGYFAAKPFFQGRLLREIMLTLYDKRLGASSYAYFFLCERNILLFAHQMDGAGNVLAELDSKDIFTTEPADSPSLKDVITANPHFERALSARTSGKTNYVLLNGNYLLLLNIQPDRSYGSSKGSLRTIYLTGGNYLERTENALRMMREILAGGPAGNHTPIHGIGSITALINIHIVAAVSLAFPLFFLAFLGLSLMFSTGPFIAWGLAFALYLFYLAWILVL